MFRKLISIDFYKKALKQGVTLMLVPHSQNHVRKLYLNYSLIIFILAGCSSVVIFSLISTSSNKYFEKKMKIALDENASIQSKVETFKEAEKRLISYMNYLNDKGDAFYGSIWENDINIEQINKIEFKEDLQMKTGAIHEAINFLIEREKLYVKLPLGWPVKDAFITSVYGERVSPFGQTKELHSGYDFAAAPDTPIYATADGHVTFAGNLSTGYGNYLKIQHSFGFSTLYGHCSKILVKPDSKVNRGQLIALVGRSGTATGYHLHYEVRMKDIERLMGYEIFLNPLPFMQSDL
ncbi:MAG: M23 family metallopeptidase [Spirochaetia bacterium]|nr:M23 family metallopeptidase [Spirochaetia bacterium]